ncbi:hypothetical protein JTB14_034197 [Gonioctena quinquepunctata]|nr:hypothetical protein JTB14_034197 [Gonioctena quinquepunctata]
MDELITQLAKLLSYNIVVHIYSYPHFAIELLLALAVCIAHCLLIFEINNLYKRTNAKAAINLGLKHPQLREVESSSYQTISTLHTQIPPQQIGSTSTRQSNVPSYRVTRKLSTASTFGSVVPTNYGEPRLITRHAYNDRVDHLLSLSPSEYVRKDRERKYREAGLKSCIHSLTSLLEKALNDDNITMESVSKGAIKKSINAIKENFENQILGDRYSIGESYSPSLHSLLNQSVNNKSLKNSLVPRRFVSFSLSGDGIDTLSDYEKRKSSHSKVDGKESSDDSSDEYKSTDVVHSEGSFPRKT